EQRFTILSLLVGLLLKLSLNIPLIKLLETKGAILATAIGYGAAIIINFFVIKKFAGYPLRFVWRRSLLIVIFSAAMLASSSIAYWILTLFLSTESKFQSIIIIGVCAIVGAAVYFYLAFRSKLVYLLFGERAVRIKEKLRLRV
ncbi:MAG TPA: polysaccharide biosynthesis C-terminal domain-containing protein, partial [Pseudoneobacillus sp.]|nr:polysaccharide biosynthesis C-terminal domain-containing protein [Pseudoneobacillus sp.]